MSLPRGWELIIIFVIVLVIFGPRLLRSSGDIGRGIREFRKGLKGEGEEKPAESEKQEPPQGGASS
ncbi:MAG: twin-arginine translocase TatA/TatE family subunit [Chloroflexota bacterium]